MYRLGIVVDQDEKEAKKHYENVVNVHKNSEDDHYQKALQRLKELYA